MYNEKIGILEEVVSEYIHPQNNTYPLWNYGNPVIVRDNDMVYVTIPETSETETPFLNTRLQVFRKAGNDKWEKVYSTIKYDQREPCPIARKKPGNIVVSINTGIVPFRTSSDGREIMWYCEPYLLEFDENNIKFPKVLKPKWDEDWSFTDHSYRGIATDPSNGSMYVMNQEGFLWKPGYLGRYHWAYYDENGQWANCGVMSFDRRTGYPMLCLRDAKAYFCATSDIDEPNEEWMAYKREVTGQWWDFDFRKLYLAKTDDISEHSFGEPLVVEDVDSTCGFIRHCDMFVDRDGVVSILYIVTNCLKPFMRDKFFSDMKIRVSLRLCKVKDGVILSKQDIYTCSENKNTEHISGKMETGALKPGNDFHTDRPVPSCGAFAALDDGRLYVVYSLSGYSEDEDSRQGNYVVRISPSAVEEPTRLELETPLQVFFAAAERSGSQLGKYADLFGLAHNGVNELRYVRLQFDE